MKKKINVLSIDGGGIRGLVAGRIIKELETMIRSRTGQETSIADSFDMIAGTSTGGILALLYLHPDGYSAQDALELYLKNGGKIFESPLWRKLTFGLFEEKYPSKNIEAILDGYLKDYKMSDLKKDCMITTFDTERYEPVFFTRVEKGDQDDVLLKSVARSTSAAPTFFEPAKVWVNGRRMSNLDGGLFANNPALFALIEACKTFDCKPHEVNVVSIGTGAKDKDLDTFTYKKARKWGAARWIVPLLDIMLSASAEVMDHSLGVLMKPANYHRFQPVFTEIDLRDVNLAMDDASKKNMDALLVKTELYLGKKEVSRELEKIAEALTKA
jgi:patatin-like phospholipase/acyl hydrolase